jgi:hypothetical protein
MCLTFRDCGTVGTSADRVEISPDSAFRPITKRDYRANPLSFKKDSKPALKLPAGKKQSDVARTIAVVNHAKGDTTIIIVMKDGGTLVPKTADSASVLVTEFLPPVVTFGLTAGIGASVDLSRQWSPAAVVSLFKWYGVVDAPVAIADLQGVAIGADFKLYHDIYVAPAVRWQFGTLDRSIILTVSYQL